jgi:selenocysteine lyase/cysteine desulfurase
MDRRNFFKNIVGGSALSLLSLKELNAAIYDNLTALNEAFQGIPSPDGVYWNAVRKHYLFEDNLLMMNNGTVGPIPQPVYNTLMKYFEVQVKAPCDCYMYLPTLVRDVRSKLARFINASPDEVAILRNTTEGMNFIANGLELTEGDEVLISNMEHAAGTHPWRLKEKRYGIKLKDFPLGIPPKSVDEILESFKKAITPKTRVLSISQTVYITGLIAPIKELAEEAHKRDILVAVDSAHAIGMLDLDMSEIGADFWCSSPYKWMGSPPGVGVFYVSKPVQDRLWPTIASSGWDTRETAGRFETLSQRADALILAFGEAINFQNHIGKPRIERRIRTLAGHLKDHLIQIPGVKLHTPQDEYLSAGLTAFSIKDVEPTDIVNYLREKYNIVIRTIGSKEKRTHGVRVSTNIYVSLKDVDLLLEGIRYLANRT